MIIFFLVFSITTLIFIMKTFLWLSKQTLAIKVKENSVREIKTVAWPKYEMNLDLSGRPDKILEHRISEEKYQIETLRYSHVTTERLFQDSRMPREDLKRMIKRKQEDAVLNKARSFIEYKARPYELNQYGEEIQEAELKVLRRI